LFACGTDSTTVDLDVAPISTIVSPNQDVTITPGGSVDFQGSASDSDGTVASHQWAFGDGGTSSIEDPGFHVYSTAGTYTATYRVTDNRGANSAVASRTIAVQAASNAAPLATIVSPNQNVTIAPGGSVDFQGSASDADGTVASHQWAFGDGGTSSVEDPGSHVYSSAGTYTATYRVTDNGGANSAVASRTIAVQAASTGHVVIFEDGFETGNLSRWDQFSASKYAVTTDRVRSGVYGLRATTADFGELNKWFMPGFSEVHVQFDVLFQEGFRNLRSDGNAMHFFAVLGNRVDNRSSAHGKAGIRPNGTDYFLTVVDPEQTRGDPTLRPFEFYTSFPDMNCSGSTCYGNTFQQTAPKVDLVPGRWYHIEVRLKANTVGQHDGFQELWIDGVRKIAVTGMRWRDTNDLRINEVAVWNYMPGAPPNQYLWIDNVRVTRPE